MRGDAAIAVRQPKASTASASGVAPSRLPTDPRPIIRDDSMAKRSSG